MRIECNRHRPCARLLCVLNNVRKHVLVAAMHTIKVADADYGGIPVRGNLIQMAKNAHH
jgi:hypothetical protein